MANAYIREYSALRVAGNGTAQIPMEPAVGSQTVSSITTTSKASAAFNDGTNFVWIAVDGELHFNASEAADTNDVPTLKPGVNYFFGVKGGSTFNFRTPA